MLGMCLGMTWYGTVPLSHLVAMYLEGKGWPPVMAKMTGQCPGQLMSILATVLNMFIQGEGVQEKHNLAMTKIRFGSLSIKFSQIL